jgi:hypothetical protein
MTAAEAYLRRALMALCDEMDAGQNQKPEGCTIVLISMLLLEVEIRYGTPLVVTLRRYILSLVYSISYS